LDALSIWEKEETLKVLILLANLTMDNADFGWEFFNELNEDSESSNSDEGADATDGEDTFFKGRAFTSQLSAEWSSNMIGTDVILRTEASATDLHCHKFLLAARSKVFKAMFKRGMEESQNSIVEVPDCLEETLISLLKFVYTDKVKSEDVTMDLMKIAHQYQITELKSVCSVVMSTQVTSVDNVGIEKFSLR